MAKRKLQDIMLGKRYYTYDEKNNLKVIRILRIYDNNHTKILAYDELKGMDSQFIISKKDLDNYILLKPDMVYTFSMIATTPGNDCIDIMIYLMRKQDANKSLPLPSVITRQMSIKQQEFGLIRLGDTVSNCESDPDGYKYFMTCDHIIDSVMVNGYIDDTKKDILKFIPKKTLLAINSKMKSNANKFKTTATNKGFNGTIYVPETIKALFYNASEEIDTAIGIFGKVSDISDMESTVKWLEENIGYKVKNLDIIEYKKDINLDLIKTEYKLIRDGKTDKVYLVNYIKAEKIKTEIDADILKAFE